MGDLKGEKEITRIRITGGAIFLGIIAAHQVEALAPASGCWTCRQRQTRGPWEVSGRDLRQVNTPGRMFRGEREPLTGEAREATSMRLGVEPCRFLWWELLMPQVLKSYERRLHLTVATSTKRGVRWNWVCIPTLQPTSLVTLCKLLIIFSCLYFIICKMGVIIVPPL